MSITKRVWCLHNGNPMHPGLTLTRFVNKDGIVCNHTNDYVWWQNLGLFLTKAQAIKYAREHHINLDAHGMTIHSDWMYKMALEDMVRM